ncbi:MULTISPECIES: transporter substrate-binding domain-containing protein [Vibrio]|uniref:substrate-binding periplasmic protein n=1 Tax=Vibrio TaxID=662 RepID=UPI000C16FC4F|nr:MULTISPECIES: transporter substrate-binding domain-containing protein [Vibrio]NAX04692.1 transporter substrate-binding domain-containing protein [Vibrio sp. V30_P3S12P165]NNN43720.1 transporter substrate-binding domain-containing protein [Vibrio sp. 1-1(7)]NNN71544.1 transporter substrate-binding domain-containing protein [Vibrio sp. 12-2(3-a)]
MKIKFILTAVLLCFSSIAISASLSSLKFITENYPPFNYEQKGQLTGIAIDILEHATQAVNDPVNRQDVSLQPWARGYASALNTPNTVLFSMTRTDARENLFKWAGPIVESRIVLWAAKDRQIKLSSITDVNNYRVGVVREDIGEQLLKSAGVNDNVLRSSATPEMVVRQLDAQRIDLWAYGDNVGAFIMREHNIDPNNYEIVYVLHESQTYFAFHKDTPDEYVSKIQQGIDIIKENNKLNQIIDSYR